MTPRVKTTNWSVDTDPKIWTLNGEHPDHIIISRENVEIYPVKDFVSDMRRQPDGGALYLTSENKSRVLRNLANGQDKVTSYRTSSASMFDVSPNGEVLFFGSGKVNQESSDIGHDFHDGLVTKVDQHGEMVWSTEIDIPSRVQNNYFSMMEDGSVLGAAHTNWGDVVFKVSSEGVINWKVAFETEPRRYVEAMVESLDGDILVFGRSGANAAVKGTDRFWTSKVTAGGTIKSEKFFEYGRGETLIDVKPVPGSSNYMAVGTTTVGFAPGEMKRTWVAVFDKNGEQSSYFLYDGDISEVISLSHPDAIFPNPDGTSTIAGVGIGGNAWFLRIDSSGAPIETRAYYQLETAANGKRFRYSYGNDDSNQQIVRVKDGSFVFEGRAAQDQSKQVLIRLLPPF